MTHSGAGRHRPRISSRTIRLPGDELPAGPVAAAGRQTRAERIRAAGGQDYRVVMRGRANRYAAATCCGLQPTIFDGSPFFLP